MKSQCEARLIAGGAHAIEMSGYSGEDDETLLEFPFTEPSPGPNTSLPSSTTQIQL